jgi:hypothetical protein
MITGTVVFDLRDAELDRMRHRVAALPEVPTGARAVVVVGALAPEPTVVRALAIHERRLQIDLHGTPFAVRRWLEALRTSSPEVLL